MAAARRSASSQTMNPTNERHRSLSPDNAVDARVRQIAVVCCVCSNLLRNPQLLDCLHSCCADCCSAAAASPAFSAAAEGSGGADLADVVRCPICHEATPTRRLRRNGYAAALVATHLLDAKTASCGTCVDNDGGKGEQATTNGGKAETVKWCSRCDMHLCAGCSVWHNRFQKHPRAVVDRSDANGNGRPRLWQQLVPSPCSEHGADREAEFFCRGCRRFACAECVRRCVGAGHPMEVVAQLSGEQANSDKLRQSIAAEADVEAAALESHRPLIRSHGSDLVADLDAALAADRERLEERRREVLQLVASAFDQAAAELDEIYGGLRAEAADVKQRAAAIDAKAAYAAAYWAQLREAAGAACLFEQQAVVRDRLRTLREAAATLPPTFERDRWTRVGGQKTRREDLDKIIAGWFGSAQKIKGTLADVLVQLASGTSDSDTVQQNGNGTTTAADAATAPICLEEALSFENAAAAMIFPVTPDCRNVACTADGRLLVAALRNGLLQFDLVSSRQLQTWHPEPRWDGNQDSINVVAALDDGRVVIGDAGSDGLVLLRRKGEESGREGSDGGADESWIECHRIFPGYGPWSVAVNEALIAVSSSRVEHVRDPATNSSSSSGSVAVSVQCSPGPQLALLPIDGGRKKLELTLDYNVSSVALSSSVVVCASDYSLQRAIEADASFIDCYGHDGQLRWRHRSSELVAGLLAVPLAGCVYASLPNSALVVALSIDDGSVLRDVLAQRRHRMGPPRALALCRLGREAGRRRRVALAVLTFLENTVALYPFVKA